MEMPTWTTTESKAVNHFKHENSGLRVVYQPCCGRPRSVTAEVFEKKTDAVQRKPKERVWGNRIGAWHTEDRAVSVSTTETLSSIPESLISGLLPRMTHVDVSSQLLRWHASEDDDFLFSVAAGDEN
ncbi:hypothetical protein L798_04199 [Zootermopsis nevadensis]|uniref:Uncharacterized protein n=1 Tax=Zootermopsis nevadensis TaxID=136037 RepID=A0A067RBX9_ZOONE|nr:hypothetical protein L798_04199 [Zootermopsis nevadensis]